MDKVKLQTIPIKFNQYLLLMIFCALVLSLMIFQANKLVGKEISELDQKKVQKAALEERITNLSKLESNYKAISAEVDFISSVLPKQDKLVDIIATMEKKAVENKVEFAIKFDSEPANHKVPAKLSVKGYYNDVMSYYKWLTSGEVLVNISAADLSDPANLLDNTKAEFVAEVYFD